MARARRGNQPADLGQADRAALMTVVRRRLARPCNVRLKLAQQLNAHSVEAEALTKSCEHDGVAVVMIVGTREDRSFASIACSGVQKHCGRDGAT